MKVITKVEEQKKRKHRYNIYLDDEFAFGVDENVLVKYALTKGKELSADFIENVLKAEENNKAMDYAVHLLDFRQRSVSELRSKLKTHGYETDAIEHALEVLQRYGYVNDYTFGQALVKDKQNFKNAGAGLLKRELYRKGINKDLISQLIEENVEEDGEHARALELAEKKVSSFRSDEDYNSKYRKLSSFLVRKGYQYSIISKIIKEVLVR